MLTKFAVGRRLFRDGTSEYQINNTTARLRNNSRSCFWIRAGAAMPTALSIAGSVRGSCLEANPEERRVIFEEAAGIPSSRRARMKRAQLERFYQI